MMFEGLWILFFAITGKIMWDKGFYGQISFLCLLGAYIAFKVMLESKYDDSFGIRKTG